VAAYLANGNYSGTRWCRDVDLILTDSHATAQMYKEKDGIDVTPIGPFIDPTYVVAEKRDPKHVLLVNPSLAKGAAITIRLAMTLEKERPDITFEVVQSRGNWEALVRQVTKQFGEERSQLSNVILTPNTPDMRPIYARAKVLLALSLWWESFGRVVTEAGMNGIPQIVSSHGGLLESAGSALPHIVWAKDILNPPYNKIPRDDIILPIKKLVVKYHEDKKFYKVSADHALATAANHSIEKSTHRLTTMIKEKLR
jgi:glycosyltransferase involved in cell wall biosynthesis